MRILLAALAIVGAVNGFSFFGKKEEQTSDSMLSLRASIPVAEAAGLQLAAVDTYDSYVNEVLYCYDKDANGQLDKSELKKMFQSITDDSVKCEVRGAAVDPQAQLINAEDRKNIQMWFGERKVSLKLLYSKSLDGCNSSLAKSKINGKPNIFAVYKSTTGHVFGGYTAKGFQYSPSGYQSDPEAFMFSLTKNIKLKGNNNGANAIFFNEYGKIIVWGDMRLQDNCMVNFDLGQDYPLPAGYYNMAAAHKDLFGGDTVDTASIEVFQLTFQ